MHHLFLIPPGLPRRHCQIPTAHSTCKRPAHSYYPGINGPWYYCAKHTRVHLLQRPDFSLTGPPS